jgi:Tfp pilus assembly protein PilW
MTSAPRPVRNDGGFALLELLVAFTILCLVLGPLYSIIASTAQRASLVQRHTRALELATSRLAEAGTVGALASGTVSGSLEEFEWRRTVAPNAAFGPVTEQTLFTPFDVSVDVQWREPTGARTVTLRTIRLGPRP